MCVFVHLNHLSGHLNHVSQLHFNKIYLFYKTNRKKHSLACLKMVLPKVP